MGRSGGSSDGSRKWTSTAKGYECSRVPSPRGTTARRDRAREPFARNRLQLRLRRPAGIDIVGTRGVSHFFESFLNLKKKHHEERSQQPQPASNLSPPPNPSARPCSGGRGELPLRPSSRPRPSKYPKIRAIPDKTEPQNHHPQSNAPSPEHRDAIKKS